MKKTIVISVVAITVLAVSVLAINTLRQKRASSGSAQQTDLQARQPRATQPVPVDVKKQEAAKVSSLMFDSQQQTLSTGSPFTLKAMADPKGKKISAAKLEISFDPSMVELDGVEPDEKFSLVLSKPEIDNKKGTATITLGVPLEKPAITAVSTVASFNFKTLSSNGQTKINFTDKSGAAADGETSSVISSLIPVTITIK